MKRRMHVSTMWESEKFAALSLHARLLMIALIDVCDDQGRFRAHPAWLRSNVFPYDDVRLSDVEGWLQEVAGNETVMLYEVEGQRYGQLVKWWVYQKPQYASPSLLPAPEGWQDRIRQKIGKQILVHNWTDNDGNLLPDTCDAYGNTPVKTRVSTPVPTPGRQDISIKDKDNDQGQVNPSGPVVVVLPPLERNPLFQEYEKNIGIVTPMIQDTILKAEARYPTGWVLEALQMAPQAERPSWAYVKGILKNWEEEGRNNNGSKPKVAAAVPLPPLPEEEYHL